MEKLENALKFYDKEIELHTEKLVQLKQTLANLTPLAHELSVEYASTNATEIGIRLEEVGKTIAGLEKEIERLDNYIQGLWNSKTNYMETLNQDNKTR